MILLDLFLFSICINIINSLVKQKIGMDLEKLLANIK